MSMVETRLIREHMPVIGSDGRRLNRTRAQAQDEWGTSE